VTVLLNFKIFIALSQNPSNLQSRSKEIASRVQNIIPSAYLHGKTTLNLIKYSIPIDQCRNLPILFSELEKIKDIQVCFIEFCILFFASLTFKHQVLKRLF